MSEQTESESTTAELSGRLDRVEGALGEIKAMLSGGERKVHAAAADHEAAKLDAPSTVAEEVRAQLEERDRSQAEQSAKQAEGDRLAAVETRMAEMSEQKPEPPIRRVERFMWGARG